MIWTPVPCKAYDLLSKADVIIVNDYHLKSWIIDPIDDCGEYSVSRESLAKLRHLCQETLETGTTSLLPTQSGFFFGSTEYDNYYKSDLKSTINQLDNVLDNPKFKNWEFYYRSSW